MQKIAPMLAILLIVGLLGTNFAYGDYTEYMKIRIESDKPNVCVFEAEDSKVDFEKRGLYKKTIKWISEWSKQLKKEANDGNWSFTYELIHNSTHFDKKPTDFPQCNVLIVFDAENLNPIESDLGMAQGYTSFDYRSSTHKFSFIDIFTFAPTNVIDLGQLNFDNMTKSADGSYEVKLGKSMFTSEPISDEAIRIVIQHEFAHALGLGHYVDTTTNDFKSIMMPQFDVRAKGLENVKITLDDIKALIELYGEDGIHKYYQTPIPDLGYGYEKSVKKN